MSPPDIVQIDHLAESFAARVDLRDRHWGGVRGEPDGHVSADAGRVELRRLPPRRRVAGPPHGQSAGAVLRVGFRQPRPARIGDEEFRQCFGEKAYRNRAKRESSTKPGKACGTSSAGDAGIPRSAWQSAIVGFVLMIAVGNLIAAVAKSAPANRFEVFFGFVIGVLVGGGFYKASSGFADVFRAALPDERDRLLVQYHDAVRSARRADRRRGEQCGLLA